MELTQEQVPLDDSAQEGLARTLGVDLDTDVWDPCGPLTLASTSEVCLLMAGQLYHQGGKTWNEALSIIQHAEQGARATLDDDSLIRPIGDVRGLLSRLHDRGILLAMATTDVRKSADHHLQKLGLTPYFEATVCDGDGIALKPAPDMALELCRRLRIAPRDAIMIGDTVADLEMARQAGLQAAIGVASGAMTAEMLAPHADWVIPDIHALQILGPDEDESA